MEERRQGSKEERSIVDLAESRASASARTPADDVITWGGKAKQTRGLRLCCGRRRGRGHVRRQHLLILISG